MFANITAAKMIKKAWRIFDYREIDRPAARERNISETQKSSGKD